MEGFRPSATALSAARYRAEHQVIDHGKVFADPYACAILGEAAPDPTQPLPPDRADWRMRFFIAARSRFADEALARAVARGTRQAVVLGAGLDTLALRNPHAEAGLRIFEIDHPATQAWKRERLAAAGIAEPMTVTFVPLDFERDTLGDALAVAGFRSDAQAFFVWLGVVPYLTRDAIFATLAFVAGISGGEVVFDYGVPREGRGETSRAAFARRSERVAALGEPWISLFEPAELAERLRGLGFDGIEDLGSAEIAARYFGAPPGTAGGGGGHFVHARRRV
jgi:methyltransferase (TIGR00027 family)